MDSYDVADDILHASQTDACHRQPPPAHGGCRTGHVHHDRSPDLGEAVQVHVPYFKIQGPGIDMACIPLSTRDGHVSTLIEHRGGISCTHDSRNTQLAAYDCGMRCPASRVGYDSCGTLHYRYPVWIRCVRDENGPIQELIYFRRAVDLAHRACCYGISNAQAFGQQNTGAFELIGCDGGGFPSGVDRLWSGLDNEQVAIGAIFGPLYVHGTAVMCFNDGSPSRQCQDLIIGKSKGSTLLWAGLHGHRRLIRHVTVYQSRLFGAQGSTDYRYDSFPIQMGFVHAELVRRHTSFYHHLSEAPGCIDKGYVWKARFRVQREHDPGSSLVGTYHSLYADGNSHLFLLHTDGRTIGYDPVRKQGSKALPNTVEELLGTAYVQIGFQLTGKTGLRKIFGCCAGAHGHSHEPVFRSRSAGQFLVGVADSFLHIGRK